jgi:tetratricopeptide (TPR) repeat protein
MKIIKGKKLKYFIEDCNLRLDPFFKQLGKKKYPPNSGRFMLYVSRKNDEMWLLEKEIEAKTYWFKKERYFEFEGFGPNNEGHKIYIPCKELIEFLLHLSSTYKQFHISMLADTVGLKDNTTIKGNFEEHIKSKNDRLSLSGFKPEEEIELNKEANQSIKNLGTGKGSNYAMDCYSQIIELNPTNAVAFFNKGLAMLDFWRYEKGKYLWDKRNNEEVQNEIQINEKKIKIEAEKCFQKALELNPYLSDTYEKLSMEGRIYTLNDDLI